MSNIVCVVVPGYSLFGCEKGLKFESGSVSAK